MAEIPSIKRFRTEDYEDIDSKLIDNLNQFAESVVNALTGNINMQNIAGDIFERVGLGRNTDVSPGSPLKLSWNKKGKPASVCCGGIWLRGADAKSALSVNISLEWDYDDLKQLLLIKKINGLTLPSASAEYEITIQAFCK